MTTKQEQTKFCQKLVYGIRDDPTIIYGVVLEENNNGFLIFKTGKKIYKISRSVIISFEGTDVPFREENAEGGGNSA